MTNATTLELFVAADGSARCLYGETLNLASLGSLQIERASHVEPDDRGRWMVDLSPVDGPTLGPYLTRSHALSVEAEWLLRHRLTGSNDGEPFPSAKSSSPLTQPNDSNPMEVA